MVSVIIKLKEQSLRDVMSRIDKQDQRTTAGLSAAVARNVLEIETQAKKSVPVNTGRLRNSITHYKSGLSGYVAAHTNYAIGVEDGTTGGTMPSYKAIEYWFIRKNKLSMKKKWDYYPLIQAIRQKIYDKGTPAQPFLVPAWEKQIEVFFKDCKEVLGDAWAV